MRMSLNVVGSGTLPGEESRSGLQPETASTRGTSSRPIETSSSGNEEIQEEMVGLLSQQDKNQEDQERMTTGKDAAFRRDPLQSL